MDSDVTVTIADIRAAREVLSKVIRPTPLKFNRALSERVGADVFLKCENLQRAGSFKIRGAYTRMSRLSPQERAAGVVAASAGNHAQGVALAAQMLGIASKVYMPVRAPMPKLAATRAYGAEVEQVGETLDESLLAARAWADETGAILIHPFDHADIVAGQGTCGWEILDQCPEVRTVVVGLGGGGLLAGIATVMRALKPDVHVIGVQAEQAAAYPDSLAAGHPVKAARMATMADGIAVGLPGDVTFPIVRDLVDEVVTVSEASLSRAALFLLERAKLVVEPAGAAATAYLLDRAAGDGPPLEGPVVTVLSGGNIDPLLMLRIIRHGMTAAGRYLQFSVVVPDSPGNLAQLLTDCASVDANVLDVEHLRTSAEIRVDQVEIGLVLETRGPEHQSRVLEALRAKGYVLLGTDQPL
ncbi:MAG TPA: threonine ammonia-lyase [Phycicoccus elongatus]|jgi:threonine dehydratase|uniref:threonine ammonia-lyase n=1 Tax=Phycicoccus TaxID=367298 RepID=UPI002B695961|nr:MULTISPECIES: threonine ammonia-lyase [Phycicoccus]MBK8728630.1 threonine ammonia-lyase [Tetrasphaera sp.]MCB9406776.1 threonine ammonia-lyase [Tetrasphaera sp.]HPF76792.1 threonine ammonia-lyase [Phycicoccus elongatus]HPK11480.1 threonine ammonia-lyase [Phycicoccus elongatus]HPQ72568.1 threonine ammonia-lyase [Phycicoccus elongatus]